MDSSLKRELKLYQKRKAKAQDKGDLEEESKMCYASAELLTQHGFYGDAVKEYKQALQVAEAREDTIGSAVAHRMVGECLCALGKYKDALFHQNLHLQLAKSSNNLVEQQRAWATIGRTWFVYSDSAVDAVETEESLMESQKAYLEALSVCDKLQGITSETELLEMRARLYLNLGLVYDSKNDTPSARKFIDKALYIAREQHLQETEFRCHYCIGIVLMKVGLDKEAQCAFEKAVQVAKKNNKKLDEADALVQLGQVHLKMGDFLLARRTLKKAYKISPSQAGAEMEGLKSNLVAAIKGLKLINKLKELSELKDSDKMKIFDALGDLYSNVKSYQKALECYDKELDVAKSIGLSPKKLSPIYVSLAMTYSDLGDPKKAVECYMEELGTIDGNYKGMCDTWCNVAQVYENSGESYEEIERAYLTALKYAEQANKLPIQVRVYRYLADTQRKYDHMKDYAETMKKVEELESKFGIEEESDEDEEEEDKEDDDENDDDDNDDDDIIQREMLLPDSDEEYDNEDENDESVIKHRTRTGARTKLSKRNEKGETPLQRAAIAGDTELVRRLIEQGADINTRDYCGWQPLHEACNHGYTEIVRLLLAKGAHVNDPGGPHCQGVTPLHDAAQNGHIEIVKLLVENGASLLSKDTKGNTPLDAVLSAQESEEDRDLIGCETEAAAGRRQVVNYLKKISLGGTSLNRTEKKQPEMRRRNRLFLDNFDDNNNDDDDDDVVRGPPTSKITESRSVHDPVSDFSQGTSSKIALREKNYLETNVESDVEVESVSEDGDISSEGLEDESPYFSVDNDFNHDKQPTRRSSDSERISIDDSQDISTDWHSRDHHNTSSYLDTISGKRLDANSSRQTTALVSERDLGSTSAIESASEDSDWLINDMPERPTKRRRTNKQATLSTSLALSRRGPSTYNSKSSRSKNTSNISKKPSRPKQTRLEVRRTPSPTYFSSSPVSQQSSNTLFQGHSLGTSSQGDSAVRQTSSASTPGGAPPMRIRVQIQGKTFLIPCPEKNDQERKTMAWLSEQAKLRYFSAFGLRPVLALQTSEGAFLSPEDKISDVLSNNEQIVASVESWDLPPVAERYKTACISNNCEIKKDIQALLQAEPQISVISLGNLALQDYHVLPLARALQCHDRLVKLILPGNKIGDSGVQHIAASLSTLPNLSVLDLRSNGISHKGITYLANALSKTNDNQEITSSNKLEELNIGYNALYDMCGSSLTNILVTCSQLITLLLQSCCFTGKLVEPSKPLAEALKASSMRYLSIAHNNFEGQGLCDLLSALPCQALRHLDVSSTVCNKSEVAMAIDGLAQYMEKDDCALQNLNLSNCCLGNRDMEPLTDTHCFKDVLQTLDLSCNYIENDATDLLSRLVSHSQTLVNLSFSGNPGIDSGFLELFLDAHRTTSSRVQYINLSACNINSPISDDMLGLLRNNSTDNLMELNLSFCPLNQTDKLCIAETWKKGAGGANEREAIVQDCLCILGTSQQ